METRTVAWQYERSFFAFITFISLIFWSVPGASQGRAVPLEERAHDADQVVVATVTSLTPRWATNEFGDRLIVSRVSLRIEETLKGIPIAAAPMDLEGGTLDGLTLRVSSLPALVPGERGVFFLNARSGGVYHPHLAGQGILKLDDADLVRGSTLSLATVRSLVRQAAVGVQR